MAFTTKPLTAQLLTPAAFSPFGDVIEASEQAEKITINYGLTQRYHALATVDVNDEKGNAIISIFRSTPKSTLIVENEAVENEAGKNDAGNNEVGKNGAIKSESNQLTINCMERHPLSSQAFYPLSTNPYLVVVAPKGTFDASKIQVFIASENQGVNYHKGTWHHYCLALKEPADFLVIDRQGVGKNCDEVDLVNPITIEYDLTNRSVQSACQ